MQRGNNNYSNRVAVHQACASCKHQRKRCAEDCVLAPYFPAERAQEFQAVHKVFGVSNVVKLVKGVKEDRREETVDSLVWEAACRQNDPVLGSYGKYKEIKEEFELFKMQHPLTNQNLNQNLGTAMYKKQSPVTIAWNGTNGINGMNNRGNGIGVGLANNNMVNYGLDNSNLIVDSIPHNYRWQYVQSSDKSNQERDDSSLLLPMPSPLPYQQQYYLPGQFGPVNGKPMDNTLFMGEEDEPLSRI
ncbi:unnamed protein product [Dovyalis caffra]|uniref:LOB domain-containing protein n=1 Tax=Dovyalis caffra TaxID=77055 RepID=A0AAV1RUA3_9ROSI|nr:unnamed protein product [Dovyalis caffra]